MRTGFLLSVAALCWLAAGVVRGQEVNGALIGSLQDAQGGVIAGATINLSSIALMGGSTTTLTNEKGQFRFLLLPPGRYRLEIALQRFAPVHDDDVRITAGATLERNIELSLAGVAESIVVEGAGSRVDTRDPGFTTHFGFDDVNAIPTRRVSMFDWIRAAPGISATSPSSGSTTTVSAFGSGTNENQFLIDGTNFTCPCNGIARAEPGISFIEEVQVESAGASAEFGNLQGAVINVVTRQGGDRLLYDVAYFGQTAALTSQPVKLPFRAGQPPSGYERSRYRDATTDFGGPALSEHLWFFGGYQYLRDYDSQPGADPAQPRTYEQNKIFAKLTWRFAPTWQLIQSVHDEHWVNPEQPTAVKPFVTTLRAHASVPAITFGYLTHTLSANTLWDARVGRFVYTREDDPSSGDRTAASYMDSATGISRGGPPQFSSLTLIRTTAKTTFSQYRPGLMHADHQFKMGGQFERGEHRSPSVIPTGVRYVENNGVPVQSTSSAPSNSGGVSLTSSVFGSDAATIGHRLTISAGVRFDHSRAVSQDLPAIDLNGRETDGVVGGLGTMYTWNILSPRLGMTARLSADGRTMLRASYGRFAQGVLTGELGLFHPGVTPIITRTYDAATGDYTGAVTVVDPKLNLRFDRSTRAPRTDEYSVGLDREFAALFSVATSYVHKSGTNFIGWTDVGGQYQQQSRPLPDTRTVPVFVLTNSTADRQFLLTNQDDYSLTYDGLVVALERRRSHGWQAFGSYTWSRTYGLQPSSGMNAGGAQVSTVAPPPVPQGVTFGRDPNDLINARGRLPNDRPQMFRMMGSLDVPKTGLVIAGNLGYFSGKPWAASAVIPLAPQNPQLRILLEPRGSRRLSSQTLLDFRISKTIALHGMGRVELLVDVLNVLNSAAEEGIATDNLFGSTFGQATSFVDPRRAMFGMRIDLGR